MHGETSIGKKGTKEDVSRLEQMLDERCPVHSFKVQSFSGGLIIRYLIGSTRCNDQVLRNNAAIVHEVMTLFEENNPPKTIEEAAENWAVKYGYGCNEIDEIRRKAVRIFIEGWKAHDKIIDDARDDSLVAQQADEEDLSLEQQVIIDVCNAYSRLCGKIEEAFSTPEYALSADLNNAIYKRVQAYRYDALQAVRNYGKHCVEQWQAGVGKRFESRPFEDSIKKAGMRRLLWDIQAIPAAYMHNVGGSAEQE